MIIITSLSIIFLAAAVIINSITFSKKDKDMDDRVRYMEQRFYTFSSLSEKEEIYNVNKIIKSEENLKKHWEKLEEIKRHEEEMEKYGGYDSSFDDCKDSFRIISK